MSCPRSHNWSEFQFRKSTHLLNLCTTPPAEAVLGIISALTELDSERGPVGQILESESEGDLVGVRC